MDNWPTPEKPFNEFKYVSVVIGLGRNLHQINRQTYSVLDWLGDLGGLIDALYYIGYYLMSPFSLFALQTKLAS